MCVTLRPSVALLPASKAWYLQECGYQSHCFDACCDISVPLADDAHDCTLARCLQLFTETEQLDVQYKCEGCKEETQKSKRMCLWTPPLILVIHLKRFSSRSAGGGVLSALSGALSRVPSFARMRKNTTPVDVPEQLDIAPFCNTQGLQTAGIVGLYDLIAISEHSGSMGGGHYTATGRAVSDGKWYEYNDSYVRRAECPAGPSSSAYVLFYHLRR